MESYADKFLIATSKMPDPRFARTVVYICSHTFEEGAMGVVVNYKIPDFSLANVLKELGLSVPDQELPGVYLGGPVDVESAYILHSAEYESENSMEINNSTILSRDPNILQEISMDQGPRDYLFILGYSGWGPGQLEMELTRDGWLILPADYDDLFRVPAQLKWQEITRKNGIDIDLFGDVIGTA
ncbi:MAG: YqgE/AlgH family protein [Desulfobulbaceae bacterium]|nr:YqgE/AlgH family protein [Desulfobulbaceae bacterium]